jgi:hypothetical protein
VSRAVARCAGRALGAAVLTVDGGPQDRRRYAVIVGMVVRGREQALERGLQLVEVLLVEPHHGPAEPDPANLTGLLRLGRCVHIGPGRLQRGVEQEGDIGRRGVVTGRLDVGRGVDPLDLAAGEAAVLSYLNELRLL